MQRLGDLLPAQPTEDPDIIAVKAYIATHFQETVQVGIQGDTLVIAVRSAALANTLRLRITDLRALCSSARRLIFRIR